MANLLCEIRPARVPFCYHVKEGKCGDCGFAKNFFLELAHKKAKPGTKVQIKELPDSMSDEMCMVYVSRHDGRNFLDRVKGGVFSSVEITN